MGQMLCSFIDVVLCMSETPTSPTTPRPTTMRGSVPTRGERRQVSNRASGHVSATPTPTTESVLPTTLPTVAECTTMNHNETDGENDSTGVLFRPTRGISDDRMGTRRPSVGSTSGDGLKRDHHEASTVLATSARTPTRIEQKLKAVTHFLSSVSRGLRHKHRIVKANVASQGVVMRKNQVGLSQYMQAKSAPDILMRHNPSAGIRSVGFPVRHSSGSSQHAHVSWDDLCLDTGAVIVEEDEVALPSPPRSRKRGRPSDMLDAAEIRRVCEHCQVPAENVSDVVQMITRDFGTSELDVLTLHDLVLGESVVLLGMIVFRYIDCQEQFLDMESLPHLLRHIQGRYRASNQFHNASHAADVMHTLFMLLLTTDLGERLAIHNQIAALFAAVMHDIEHVGLTNDFLIKTNHEIAVKYGTRAPLEEMHIDVALSIMKDPVFNVMKHMSSGQQKEALLIVRDTIRSTALCYQKDLLHDVNAVPAAEWRQLPRMLPIKYQVLALRCAVHVSDLSQTMKPFAIHTRWVERLNEELFCQGDLDLRMSYAVCPLSSYREKWTRDAFLCSQVGFLEALALSAADAFNSIPWVNVTELIQTLQHNINEWSTQRHPTMAS